MMRKEEGDGGAVVLHIIIFDGTPNETKRWALEYHRGFCIHAPLMAFEMRQLRWCILQYFCYYGLSMNLACLGGSGLTITVKNGHIFTR